MKCSRSLTRCDTKRPGSLTFCGDGGTDVGAGFTTLVVDIVVVLLPYLSSSPSDGTDLPSVSVGREGGGGGGRGRSTHLIPLLPSELPSVSTSVTAVATASMDGRSSAASNIRDDVARSLVGNDALLAATTMGAIPLFSEASSCLVGAGGGAGGGGAGGGVRSSSASTFGNSGVNGLGVGASVGVGVRSTTGSIEDDDNEEGKTMGSFFRRCADDAAAAGEGRRLTDGRRSSNGEIGSRDDDEQCCCCCRIDDNRCTDGCDAGC